MAKPGRKRTAAKSSGPGVAVVAGLVGVAIVCCWLFLTLQGGSDSNASGDTEAAGSGQQRRDAQSSGASGGKKPRRVAGLKVLHTGWHDPTSFTQGLEIHQGRLYESTGMYGKSAMHILEPVTGKVLRKIDMDTTLFGEGLTGVDGKLIQITWRENVGKVYRVDTLEELQTFTYDEVTTTTEGWGIAYDGTQFIVSDGSQFLHFWDTKDVFAGAPTNTRTVEVKFPDGAPCKLINELEFIPDGGGVLLANLWYKDVIVAIDPATGSVLHTYDFAKLRPHASRSKSEDCFNGIAFNATSRSLLLTGKYWPKMYTVDFPDQTARFNAARAKLAARHDEA